MPRFHAQCDWGDSGSVTLYYDDPVPYEAQEYIAKLLSTQVNVWDEENRTIYHLEQYVENIFKQLLRDKRLRKSPVTKTWMWSNE